MQISRSRASAEAASEACKSTTSKGQCPRLIGVFAKISQFWTLGLHQWLRGLDLSERSLPGYNLRKRVPQQCRNHPG